MADIVAAGLKERIAALDGLSPLAFDTRVWEFFPDGFIGVDEAGRGPLAGPVVAAAVILKPDCGLVNLRDSKLVPEKEREALFHQIPDQSRGFTVAQSEVEEIDRINILNAALSAMARAVAGLHSGLPVLVDGNRSIPGIPNSQYPLIKGDRRSAAVAAASILAKVTRDRIMRGHDRTYPQYGFGRHKGYATADHLERLRRHGPCAIHRKTFKGVLS